MRAGRARLALGREIGREPRDEAAHSDETATQADAGPRSSDADEPGELQAVRHRVAELMAENAELRRQLGQYRANDPADAPAF